MVWTEDGLQDMFDKGLVALRDERKAERKANPGRAVLVALLPADSGYDVLFEVRAKTLKRQPGEVCLPGGHVELGETPEQAAVRETCEELLVEAGQVRLLGAVDPEAPDDAWVQAFYGIVEGYRGTWSTDEVDRTFTVPLQWFLDNEPTVYSGELEVRMDDDFPWRLIPGGRNYPFRQRIHTVTMYHGTDPLIWGMTAAVMRDFAHILRLGTNG